MFYMKKLGEIISLLLMLGLVGSSQVALADSEPFEYQPVQVVYVEEESFYDRYANQGPLAEMALQYDYDIKFKELQIETIEAKAKLVQATEEAEADLYYEQQVSVDAAIAELWLYVDKTPYGFGNTPAIWDCSGLTQWYLYQRGFEEVKHSATAQVRDIRSKIVDAPIAGDLVAFQKSGAQSYFHVGVYIGGGFMIHAANPAKDTVFQSVESFADSENSRVVYLRW